MTTTEILSEFKQLTIKQQLETLKAALEIIESNIAETQMDISQDLPLTEVVGGHDPLLALAGQFEASVSDIGSDHDRYIGENLKNPHD